MARRGQSPVAKRPGRQRSTAVDEAILGAALEILVEQGYGEFTMNAVIARAGVSSATVYRRWATGDELVLAALRSIQPGEAEIDTGSLDGDVCAFVDYLAASLQSLEDLAAAEASGPRAPEALREEVGLMFAAPRINMLRGILQRAYDRGELSSIPSVSHCWVFVISPLHHRLYLLGEPLSERFLDATKVMLISGLRVLGTENQNNNAPEVKS